jgi:hypothetical protein
MPSIGDFSQPADVPARPASYTECEHSFSRLFNAPFYQRLCASASLRLCVEIERDERVLQGDIA